MAFSPDGKILAISGDGVVWLWDPATRQQIGSLVIPGPVVSVAFSPDGKTLASVNDEGIIQLWDVGYLVDVVHDLCASAGRSLTRAEWARYLPPGPGYQKICP